jgi:asparagine synthetase B (glutamine-hydrolysing)
MHKERSSSTREKSAGRQLGATARRRSPDRPSAVIHGYCSLSPQQLLAAYDEEGLECVKRIRGQYTAVFERPGECIILTSTYGACQHYYALTENGFFHGDTVLGVVQRAGLAWTWNWRALADLTQYGHTLQSDTLHPSVSRIPAASVVRFADGRLHIQEISWHRLHRRGGSSAELALEAFHDELRFITNLSDSPPVLSMSGGYDSRVILAGLLADGVRPRLLTMGFDDSTDVTIARSVAKAQGLEHATVTLAIDDYLNVAEHVARVTNGTKLALHWHTFIYPKKAGLSLADQLLVGTNGEFARSFYLDKIPFASAASLMSPVAVVGLWFLKQKIHFRAKELKLFNERFTAAFGWRARTLRAFQVAHLSHYSLNDGLDRFYLEQRVRHLMGNGIRLYRESTSWRSPFLSQQWVEQIWRLSRKWKRGSNWHRYALQRDCAALLKHPISKRVQPEVGYANYPEWFRSQRVQEYVMDQAEILNSLMEPAAARAVVTEHAAIGGRTEAMAFLITMIAWLRVVRNSLAADNQLRPAINVRSSVEAGLENR